jgi:hypothetical protein
MAVRTAALPLCPSLKCCRSVNIAELDNSDNPVKEYVRGLSLGGGIGGILYCKQSGSFYYYHYDGSGNVTSVEGQMRKIIVLVASAAVVVAVVAFLLERRTRRSPLGPGKIIPGITHVFTRKGNAADYYAKALDSLSRRTAKTKLPEYATQREREWFTQGTECQYCSFYPEFYRHVTDNVEMPQLVFQKHLAQLMIGHAREAERKGDYDAALSIYTRVGVFGWHIEAEEECLIEVLTGIQIEFLAYQQLARYYEERSDREEARRYESILEKRRNKLAEWRSFMRLESESDYARIKGMALKHRSAFWRKEACAMLADPWVKARPQLAQDAIAVLTEISNKDPDKYVRDTARSRIAYLAGKKAY